MLNIEVDPDELSYIGRSIKFSEEMIYLSNLKKGGAMNEKVTQAGRLLVSEELSNFLMDKNYIGNNKIIEKIRSDMKFTIIESFIVSSTGFYKIFNADQREFIVRDEEGKDSVVYQSFIKEGN